MFRLSCLIGLLSIVAWPVFAEELTAGARQDIAAAASRLGETSTPADRIEALREIAAIASASAGAAEADLVATLVRQMATMESAPGTMLAALAELAADEQALSPDTFAAIALPLIKTIGELEESGALLPEAIIALDDAIQRLNAVAERAGLPSVSELVSRLSGDSRLGDALERLSSIAEIARDTPDLANMNQQQTRDYIDALVSLASPFGGPAINSPAFVLARDSLAWNNEMFGQSTAAVDLVADAIETGEFDHEAYDQIRERLHTLSGGPWDNQTARDLCGFVPVLGDWCDELFQLAEEGITGQCRGAIAKVPGTREWTPACAWVSDGALVSITARGFVRYSGRDDAPGEGLSSPAGVPVNSGGQNDFRRYTPLPYPHVALVGRIGENGTPFLVAGGVAIASAEAGELFLGVNDNDTGNNDGAFDVDISISSP